MQRTLAELTRTVLRWLAGRQGHCIADITAQQMSGALRVVSDVSAKDSRIETRVKFAAQSGRPKIERA